MSILEDIKNPWFWGLAIFGAALAGFIGRGYIGGNDCPDGACVVPHDS